MIIDENAITEKAIVLRASGKTYAEVALECGYMTTRACFNAVQRGLETNQAWRKYWREEWVGRGQRNREQIALLLADNPNMTVRELGKRVGCSHQAAANHKRRIMNRGQ